MAMDQAVRSSQARVTPRNAIAWRPYALQKESATVRNVPGRTSRRWYRPLEQTSRIAELQRASHAAARA